MEFGMQFFPCVGPQQRPAAAYFDDCLTAVRAVRRVRLYAHVRTVEHYFHFYGGYSPNPIVFLTAAAQRSATARLITGAVLPVFNNPLKLAGEIGMLDAISGGRLEVGFARAFLPHEYRRFGISPDESVARFDEGMAQVRRLLEEENVTEKGRFHKLREHHLAAPPPPRSRGPGSGQRPSAPRNRSKRQAGRGTGSWRSPSPAPPCANSAASTAKRGTRPAIRARGA